jgi:hypothetical protein
MSTPDAHRDGVRRGATVDVRAALVPLWRGQVVFRVVALVYAVVSVVRHVGFYVRPALGVAVVVSMALWTPVTSVAYLRGARRLAVVDLVATVLARRVTWFGAVMLAVFGIGLVLAVVGGDPRFILLKDSFVTDGVGVVFLLSLFAARPLTFAALQSWQPAKAAEPDAIWDVAPAVRRTFRIGAVVWGVGLLLEAGLRVPLIYVLPVDVAVGASTGMQIVAFAGLGIWNAAYAFRAERRHSTEDAA